MRSELQKYPRLKWLEDEGIRPYVYVRPENRIEKPGNSYSLDWFQREPLYKNPLQMDEVDFANQILNLETTAFSASGMPMPRWVFYDCAIVPGFVAGYAIHKSRASREILAITKPASTSDWVPISLFIIIPTMHEKEWVAHNLCSMNSMIGKDQQLYGLGFLTKAFGLWYANIEVFSGITQWNSPAKKLHSYYGPFEVLTAYTPVHSYAGTMTYRVEVDTDEWRRFFSQEESQGFLKEFEEVGFVVDPKDEGSMKAFQRRLESGGEKYFLDSGQIRTQQLTDPLKVYRRKSKGWLWQR